MGWIRKIVEFFGKTIILHYPWSSATTCTEPAEVSAAKKIPDLPRIRADGHGSGKKEVVAVKLFIRFIRGYIFF
jgi:hypothetical protein